MHTGAAQVTIAQLAQILYAPVRTITIVQTTKCARTVSTFTAIRLPATTVLLVRLAKAVHGLPTSESAQDIILLSELVSNSSVQAAMTATRNTYRSAAGVGSLLRVL